MQECGDLGKMSEVVGLFTPNRFCIKHDVLYKICFGFSKLLILIIFSRMFTRNTRRCVFNHL